MAFEELLSRYERRFRFSFLGPFGPDGICVLAVLISCLASMRNCFCFSLL